MNKKNKLRFTINEGLNILNVFLPFAGYRYAVQVCDARDDANSTAADYQNLYFYLSYCRTICFSYWYSYIPANNFIAVQLFNFFNSYSIAAVNPQKIFIR